MEMSFAKKVDLQIIQELIFMSKHLEKINFIHIFAEILAA
jgi:hypothetical protein